MPAPLDLTGCRYGQLTVLRPNGRLKFGHEQTAWLCRCDCGTEITIPQNRLPHRTSISSRHAVTACSECRRRHCVICGGIVQQGSLTRETCSDACAGAHRKQIQNASYHRRVARDPDLNKRRAARVKTRARMDPAFAARLAKQAKAAEERRKVRIKTDPVYRETVPGRHRQYLDWMREYRRQRYKQKQVADRRTSLQ